MEKMKLVDTTKYERDRHSKAIISNDSVGLAAYKARKERMKEMDSYGEQINSIKQEMIDIKNLLQQIRSNQGKEA